MSKKRRTRKSKDWGKIYASKRPLFESFTMKLHELTKDLLRTYGISVAQIECRTKTVESCMEKIRREGKSYKDPLGQITDLTGVRLIAYYLEDVERIGEMIKSEFEVDEANSVDKAQAADPDRFGYLSVHYVVSLSGSRKRLTEWKTFSDLKAEIQVRTVLQHAWAAIDHKLRYKAVQDAPRDLRRQLFRLSALLELADSEFSTLRLHSEKLDEQYSKDVGKGEYDIELNLASMAAYIKSSNQYVKWTKIALDVGFFDYHPAEYEELQSMSELLTLLKSSGIHTIRDFDTLLNEASSWGKDILTRFYGISTKESDFQPHADALRVFFILVVYGKRKTITKSIITQFPFRNEVVKALFEIAYAG